MGGNRFHAERRTGRNWAIVAMIIASIFGVYCIFKLDSHLIKKPLTLTVGCRECHKPEVPKIANLKQYKRHHQHPEADDIRLARELAYDTYIANQTMLSRRAP